MDLKKLFSDKSNILIAFLTTTAIILGILILVQKTDFISKFSNATNASNDENVVENAGENVNQVQTAAPLPEDLTEDERALFDTPGPTREEQIAFQEKIEKMAVETNTLDISKCSVASPIVIKLKDKQEIDIINSDESDHIISLNVDQTYSIPAGGSEKIKIDFEHDTGVYGYGCDNSGRAIGFFLVTP